MRSVDLDAWNKLGQPAAGRDVPKSAVQGRRNPSARGARTFDISVLHAADLKRLPNDGLAVAMQRLVSISQQDRMERGLLYYRPVTEHAERMHRSLAHTIGIGGGNGSSKTESALVELVALSTGVFPNCLRDAFRAKFTGPRQQRIVLESLTTTFHGVILPKLQWWRWTGLAPVGGNRGHWGWIPKDCLKDGSWDRAWSEKNRTLTFWCRDPDAPDRILGESTIQFMSHDQDPSAAASGDFDDVLHDEPPRHAMWVENQARTMRKGGRCLLAMTWPDDPGISVDWVFDEIYDRGQPGPNKSPDVDWFEFHTVDNPHLDQASIERQMSSWSAEMTAVRIYGRPVRFSNRVHPLFTDVAQHWCFVCNRVVIPGRGDGRFACQTCGSEDIEAFNHVAEFDHSPAWPTIWVVDPHPRKPIMFAWVAIDPSDDLWVVAEGEVDGSPADVRARVEEIEEEYGLTAAVRLMDPNMGASPGSVARRGITWQDEFAEAGLFCELGDDSELGRKRINEYLRPDDHRHQPRLHFHRRCTNAVYQFKRFTWDEFRRRDEKDLKQTPRAKYDDYPAMLRYVANYDPVFRFLRGGAPVLTRPGHRRGAY